MKTDDEILAGHWEPLDDYFSNMDWDPDSLDGAEYDPRNDADAVTD